MRRLIPVAEVVLLALGAGVAAAQDPGATSSLRLVSGTINGQSVAPGFPQVVVAPGAAISGSFLVTIKSTYESVMAMGLTPTWGAHATSFVDLGGFSTPVTGLKRTVNVSLTAPSTPGVYYIITAFRAEFTAAEVMSCTSWTDPSPVWDNGDDVAGWSTETIAIADFKGTVKVNYLFAGGVNSPQYMPATAIQVLVGNSSTLPGSTSTLRLVSGSVNGTNLNPAQQTVNVPAGGSITGSFTVRIDSTFASNAVMAIGMTSTWGPHATSFVDLGNFSPTPVTNLQKTIQVNLTAPTAPGTYYLVTAFNGEFDAAHVMSCTNWSAGDPVWDNGDDIAGWSASAIETAIANGTQPVYYSFGSAGSQLINVPATAIRIVVK